jgi:hypothetical protein
VRSGLLWYDDDPERTLIDKVSRAVNRYERKYGLAPDVCFVHPSALSDDGSEKSADGVLIAPLPTVLINHMWVGREE